MDGEANRAEVRSHSLNTLSEAGLTAVIRETTRLWRKHDLGYDQTTYPDQVSTTRPSM
jgi:hypothetical protein